MILGPQQSPYESEFCQERFCLLRFLDKPVELPAGLLHQSCLIFCKGPALTPVYGERRWYFQAGVVLAGGLPDGGAEGSAPTTLGNLMA
jgi:hypothetical protein